MRLAEELVVQRRVHTDSLMWARPQHLRYKLHEELQVFVPFLATQSKVALLYRLYQGCGQLSIEGRLAEDKLEEKHADGPHVRLLHLVLVFMVDFSLHALRRHVVQRGDKV